ncbi:hypothetical protein BDZ45DRAFT_681736 [Acephala macrosclerotiorum]|nr:hypothetical protein BDZ45DRAFT_681736 [Acephala macrosclerotiorum]
MLHPLLQFGFIARLRTGLVVLKYYYILASGDLTLLYLQCPLGFPDAIQLRV